MACDRPRIVLLTGNSLCHNPRAMKEAAALGRAGYVVDVLGAWLDPEFKARDEDMLRGLPLRFTPAIDATGPGARAAFARLAQRARRRTAQLGYDLTGAQNPLQLGLGIGQMLRLALNIPAQLYLAHSEPCLAVARMLLRAGRRVGVDMEDWFSEDLLPETRRHRPLGLLRSLERELLSRGVHAACPSLAMSAALAAAYDCPPPTVVYNAFAWSDRQVLDGESRDRRERRIPSLHWFSTTLGPGRGLENLLAAIELVDHDFEIHLRGRAAPGFAEWLRTHIPERRREQVQLHPLVRNDELLSRIAEHDIGFAGEQPDCRSRDLTVTNKILHYLLAGLAVVASDTKGQREVAVRAPGAVLLYPPGEVRALAGALNRLLSSHDALAQAKAAALAAARDIFCWERQEPVLLDAIERAVARPEHLSR